MDDEPRMTMATLKVLRVLVEDLDAEHYGLAISQETGLPTGSIYPILARLERGGWLTNSWEGIDPAIAGRPRRRFYRLNGVGAVKARRALEDAQRSIFPGWGRTPGFPSPGASSA